MKPLVRFTLAQTVFINVIFVVLVVAGVFALFSSPMENLPEVDMGVVFVRTNYYGASAEDVEKLVTSKIEEALEDMDSVEYIESHSYRNYSSVKVKFLDDTDYPDLYDEIRFRILSVKKELPPGAEDPTFLHIDTHEWMPVIVVHVAGDVPHTTLRLLAEELKTRILAVEDVRSAELRGKFDREFHVSLSPEKLRAHGVTFGQAARAIASANTKIPTGRFETQGTEFMLDAGKKLTSQSEVLSIVVKKDGDGNFVRVKDLVTSARLSYRDPFTIYSVNGKDALHLWVTKEKSGNALDISEKVKAVGEAFGRQHEKDGISVVFSNDSTIEISDSLNTLGGNLILGMILVTAVLWMTLGFRNAMLTAIGIPFSFLCTFLVMRATGLSLNTITLFSFVLVTGIIVDDAVIIMENSFRHRQMGKGRRQAVVDGTAEVMMPVVASALTTVVAFLPMLIMTGYLGDFFSYVPKTVTFALLASLLEALFILPVHILDWGPKKLPEDVVSDEEDPYHHLRTGPFAPLWVVYRRLASWLLDHKAVAMALALGLFFAAVVPLGLSLSGKVPLIRSQFFPSNYFRYHVTLDMPLGTSLTATDQAVRAISKFIMGMGPGQAQAAVGTAGMYEQEDYQIRSGDYYGQVVVTLPHEGKRDFPENPKNDPMVHLDYVRRQLDAFVAKNWPQGGRPVVRLFEEQVGPPSGKPVNIRVTGTTMESALAAADFLEAYMHSSPELADVFGVEDDRPDSQKTVVYTVDQDAAYEYGIDPSMVTSVLAGALSGYPAGMFRAVDEEVPLMVRVARTRDPANMSLAGFSLPADVLNLPVVEHAAAPVYVKDLVNIQYIPESTVKNRYEGKPTVTITADIKEGSHLSTARTQLLLSKHFEANQEKFPGVSLSWAGEFEATQKSFNSLYLAFVVAVLAIYMILASQFNDYFQPVIIISAVPFALTGVVFGLMLTRTVFTVGSMMAIVGLTGVAVNNSLLLIDFMNKRLKTGKSLRDAVMESCAARLRPVVITTVTTALGLLPMAIGIPSKSISWAPMAVAFVSGLFSATLLSLLMVPVLYEILEDLRAKLGLSTVQSEGAGGL
ncbi:MAG: efflux RND transporter permease subunit [Deltaproteobacteria bacterium]|nr:efflux RND transporter permease subunit [Deltaproteobacteria bacterium]